MGGKYFFEIAECHTSQTQRTHLENQHPAIADDHQIFTELGRSIDLYHQLVAWPQNVARRHRSRLHRRKAAQFVEEFVTIQPQGLASAVLYKTLEFGFFGFGVNKDLGHSNMLFEIPLICHLGIGRNLPFGVRSWRCRYSPLSVPARQH